MNDRGRDHRSDRGARGVPRGPAGQLVFLAQNHIGNAVFGQVIQQTRAYDAAPDDDDVVFVP